MSRRTPHRYRKKFGHWFDRALFANAVRAGLFCYKFDAQGKPVANPAYEERFDAEWTDIQTAAARTSRMKRVIRLFRGHS